MSCCNTYNPCKSNNLSQVSSYAATAGQYAQQAQQSATNAATSATQASTAEAQAEQYAIQAATSAAISGIYLGAKSTAPVVDNQGNPLQEGMQYFNSVDNTMYVWDGTSWITATGFNETTNFLATGTTTARDLQERFADVVNVKDFLCDDGLPVQGDGVHNDTTGIQAAIDYANTNKKSIFVPSGNYLIQSQINKTQSFYCPNITGEGYRSTIFNFTSQIGFTIKGGSGQLAGSVISGICFNGTNTTKLVQVADQCGLTFKDCKFDTSDIGIELFNENGFTEYVVAENCEFTGLCNKSLSYRKTNGTTSFHGSGLRNCIINEPLTATSANIEIGADCFVYNSPMSFQIFKRTTQPIISHLGSNKSYIHGNITIELFGIVGNTTELVSGPTNLYIIGNIESFGQYVNTTYAIYCNRIQINNDGTINAERSPKIFKFNLTSGSNNINGFFEGDNSTLFQITLVASNYEYSYLLLVYRNSGDNNGSVNILSNMRSLNGTGWGAPTFSFSNSSLIVDNSNWPVSGVTAFCKSTYLGTRFQFRLG